MKLIIDIDEEIYKDIMAHNREMRENGKSAYYFEGLIQNGTPIPNNASNGDVIKAMFLNTELHKESDYVSLTIQDGVYLEDRDGSWWFAPHQKGGN